MTRMSNKIKICLRNLRTSSVRDFLKLYHQFFFILRPPGRAGRAVTAAPPNDSFTNLLLFYTILPK